MTPATWRAGLLPRWKRMRQGVGRDQLPELIAVVQAEVAHGPPGLLPDGADR